MSHMEFDLYDRSGEKSSVKLYLPGNLDATQYGDLITDHPAWVAALEAVTLCELRQFSVVPVVYLEAGTIPANPYAQRELRALFKMVDLVNGRRFEVGVPCPDMAELAQINTDAINMNNVQVIAYTTTLNSFTVSPYGNAAQSIGGKIVGRNV